MGEISFVEGRLSESELTHQTRMIAMKLEAAGWNPRRSDAGDVVSIGLLTGSVIRDGGWRNTNLLPIVAKRNRADVLAAFGLWLDETPEARKYARYCVITSGPRCPLPDLPDRLATFNRRISKFVERASDRWDVHTQLVALEVTFERGTDGIPTCHLHANVVYWPKRALGSERWVAFLDWMRKHFSVSQIEDAGALDDPEEVVKYSLKPGEVMQLTSDETRFLAETLHRKQLVRTTGDFGAFRSALRENREKVRFDRSEKAWVRMKMRTKEQADRDDVEADARAEARQRREAKAMAGASTSDDMTIASEPIENQIIYQTLPQARTSRLAESFVGVRGYTTTPTTEAGRRGLRILEERRREFVGVLVEKGAPDTLFAEASSRLDTCTKIPQAVASDWTSIPENRRLRMLRQVGIPIDRVPEYLHGGRAIDLMERIRAKLDRIIPVERHPWEVDTSKLVADVRERAGREAIGRMVIDVIAAACPNATVHDMDG